MSLYFEFPILISSYVEPNACDASSTIENLYFNDNLFNSFRSHGFPPKWTATSIFGNLFFFLEKINFFSSLSISILKLSGLISTKSTFAPK